MNYFATQLKYLILLLIRGYQRTLSPDHGWGRLLYPKAGCKFYPSCSEYAHQSISTHGLLVGVGLSLKRLGHCHPWSQGGFDPVR
jgi:putative membrane protein insertion efficiency factor